MNMLIRQIDFQLKCMHQFRITVSTDPSTFPRYTWTCPICRALTKLNAVDCREWKINCSVCPYARWCGFDRPGAVARANKHKHPMSVDFLVPEKAKEMIARIYPGHRVKCYIIDAKNPEPIVIMPVTSDPNGRIPF